MGGSFSCATTLRCVDEPHRLCFNPACANRCQRVPTETGAAMGRRVISHRLARATGRVQSMKVPRFVAVALLRPPAGRPGYPRGLQAKATCERSSSYSVYASGAVGRGVRSSSWPSLRALGGEAPRSAFPNGCGDCARTRLRSLTVLAHVSDLRGNWTCTAPSLKPRFKRKALPHDKVL